MKTKLFIAAMLVAAGLAGAQMFAQMFGASSRLPAGYRECNWIGLSGAQYIDTGYKASDKTILTVRFSTASANENYAIAGGRTTNTSLSYTLFALNTARNRYDLLTAQQPLGIGTNVRVANVPATVIMQNGTNYFDGGVDCSLTVAAFNCDYNLFLGAVNTAGTASFGLSGKIYFATIADGSGLVRDLVPCLNPSNVPGMYDLVGSTFYANAGTGSFSYELK